MYEIREAIEEDREQTVEMLIKTFKAIDSFEDAWVESWEKYMNRPENEDWAFVATHDGQVVANLAFFASDHNRIRGNPVRFGGVWAVATEESHRRRGLMTRIYDAVFPFMREKGIVLSILDPSPYQWAQLAYERSGYALAEKRTKFEFPPFALRVPNPKPDITVRLLEEIEEFRKIVELQLEMARFGSRVFTWPGIFKGQIRGKKFYIFEKDAKPLGCAWLTTRTIDDDKILTVSMSYFKSIEVLPSMISLILEKSNDVTRVEWNCESVIPIWQYIQNIHQLKTSITGSMMMRVVDFEGYCRFIRVPERAQREVVVELMDSQCPWNEGLYRVIPSGGDLEVERVGNSDVKPDMVLNPHQLSTIIGGRTQSSMLQKIGEIKCSYETAEKLDSIFPTEPFISYFRF